MFVRSSLDDLFFLVSLFALYALQKSRLKQSSAAVSVVCEDKLLENCNHSKKRNEKLKMIMKEQLPVTF